MRKPSRTFMAIVAVFAMLSTISSPAYADSFDLIPANDGGACAISFSVGITPLALGTHVITARGSAECPGPALTTVTVCILMQQPTGDYEQIGGACASGSSPGRASATAQVVCVPGRNYRATFLAANGGTIGKAKSSPFMCPPLL